MAQGLQIRYFSSLLFYILGVWRAGDEHLVHLLFMWFVHDSKIGYPSTVVMSLVREIAGVRSSDSS